MERKITLQEIEQLHTFVRQHYVEFYDVELELVDHLANDIEAQWQEDTQLSFDLALDRAFKRFGIFGFTDVIELKINQLKMSYVRGMIKEIATFFTWPKIVFSIALYLILFVIGYHFRNNGIWSLYIIFFTLLFFYFVGGMRWQLELKKRQRLLNRKFLLETVAIQSYAGGAVFSLMSIAIQFPNFVNLVTENWSIALTSSIVALFVLFMGLWCYVALFVLKPKLQKEILELPQKYQAV